MNKEELAQKEIEVSAWMKSKGYDRRSYREVAPIVTKYLNENDGWIKYDENDESTWPKENKFYDTWVDGDDGSPFTMPWARIKFGHMVTYKGITHYTERRNKPIDL